MIHKCDIIVKLAQRVICFKRRPNTHTHTFTRKHAHAYAKPRNALHYNGYWMYSGCKWNPQTWSA